MKTFNVLGLGFLALTISLFNTTDAQAKSPCEQKVALYSVNNTAVFARIANKCLESQIVIGYKNHGVLASAELSEMDAVVVTTCRDGQLQKKTNIQMKKEVSGAGYLSARPVFQSELFAADCAQNAGNRTLSVAFSDRKGNWDSRYGSNYSINLKDLYKNTEISRDSGADIGEYTWNIIVNELTKSF